MTFLLIDNKYCRFIGFFLSQSVGIYSPKGVEYVNLPK